MVVKLWRTGKIWRAEQLY